MDEVINLNVGGRIYTTSRSTLTRYPDSMLGAMFSGRIQSTRDLEGNYVIDGDGPLFRFVLNFLRRSVLTLPEDFKELDMLAAEADFYQIQEFIDAVTQAKEKVIAVKEEQKQQLAAIIEYEFLEVEFECAYGQWIIFSTSDVLQHIPAVKATFKDSHNFKNRLNRVEEYGLILPRDKPVNRVNLFREITSLGFTLHCTSSSGGDERSTDRWVFTREVKPPPPTSASGSSTTL
ncbi:BTB/POZ domain-containing protein KCTD15-like [Amphiura filiformis]|uniref:BTB/POZ domain-containing protein KCTD15-like n=1 Tax=Amphiura filiformis TaxID=82378 RepID=UPI003B212467